MRIPMLKIRRSRDRLIFNMGIPILVRQHLYIETAPALEGLKLLFLVNHGASTCCRMDSWIVPDIIGVQGVQSLLLDNRWSWWYKSKKICVGLIQILTSHILPQPKHVQNVVFAAWTHALLVTKPQWSIFIRKVTHVWLNLHLNSIAF